MDPRQLDVIVRIAGAALLLGLAALLARDPKGRRLAASFGPLALCLAGFLAGNTPDAVLRLAGPAGAAAHLLSGYAAVFLWWFCLAAFDPAFRPRGAVLVGGIAWILVASADRGVFGPALAERGLSWMLVAMGLGMVGHLAVRVIGDREGDLVEGRRAARIWVVVLMAGQLLADLIVDLVMGLDWRPLGFSIVQNLALLGFAGWLASLVLRIEVWPLGAAPTPVPAAPAPEDAAQARLAQRLKTLVEVERIHLDPDLTFASFVRAMGAPERTVRRFVNHRLGHDHFRAFLNAQRMGEARRLLADPARRDDKLIAIAHDAGFASLASFNRVFLATEGVSPSAWRAAKAVSPGFEERSAAF
ncbi:AraC family transcriptional regulator [Caulobacter zeae]|uniref:AraC family transcriptional regulator n=1 Tax=Caulobacter zeae TaxID=2055137 RepID=A0A2N5DSG3_9CAUL|nr:helix-turn-helix domain-containing protein [Caulobacter zeae]PLR28984.1 AraC family transcriptional regulator [Caulobacter zeae]